MADMLDYIRWRGDLPFTVSPPNEVDAVIFSTLSYIPFRGRTVFHPEEAIPFSEAVEEFFSYPEPPNYIRAQRDLDWQQASKRKAEIIPITEELELCIPDSSQENAIRGREIGKALDGFLGELPKDSRLIFLRRYWYADMVADIAKRYGMTESKVKMQLLRTRAKLKDYLEREGIAI